jgi:arylsulfatase A-like enzyme
MRIRTMKTFPTSTRSNAKSLLVLCALLALAGMVRAAEEKTVPDGRPNVLFIFADDQRADTIAALGNRIIKTPNLDRLVHAGLAFRNAYMQGGFNPATCTPSRAMLLSGQSVFHIDEKLLREETWPEAFAKAGYKTFVSGKWHNGDASIGRIFQEGRCVVGGMGDAMHIKMRDLKDGKLVARKHPAGCHACSIIADEAIGLIQKHQPDDAPFLCYLPFDAPHDPHIVPADFPVHYDPAQIPLPASFLPQHPFNNGEMHIRDEELLPHPRPPDRVRAMIADYYRYISYLDAQIGRVLDALAKSPDAKNTIVVFSADSGVARGSHGLIGKQNLYELDSVLVPLIIAGTGIPAGKTTDAMCYLFDVLPTLGQLCHVPAPPASDGRPFTATLRDPSQPSRERMVFVYQKVQRAIREGRWKLIRYPRMDQTQLFDLQADPEETTNLADKPEQTERVKALLTLLKAELAAAGDTLSLEKPRPSLSAGKPVEVSSVWPGRKELDKSHITDGKLETTWAAEERARTAWVTVDLQSECEVSEAMLSDAPYHRTREFDLEAQVAGDWKKLVAGKTIGNELHLSFAPVKARRFRLDIRKAANTPTLAEFQLFGKP